ncbi:hypothetical protein B0T25DRAFT_134682 [Lasiosphaeria hispida]|uniref:Uncharacterized protein n=1 Tax=Lasiosphaeria hispida TaxID=260671 RepID=A0AAJ0HK19_9PEZI|nr:hypothetical protein B0T25DRAFT_134682 [Lasiosphaeria hispida]
MASDKVDKYFKCTETKHITCCSSCKYATCAIGCDRSPNCKDGRGTITMDKCPRFEFSLPALSADPIPNTTYALTDSKAFFTDLASTWGIDEAWVQFSKRHMRTNNGCQYAGKDVLDCIAKNDNFFHNYPLPNNDKIAVHNPKMSSGTRSPRPLTCSSGSRSSGILATLTS